jgi:hypothetical protein
MIKMSIIYCIRRFKERGPCKGNQIEGREKNKEVIVISNHEVSEIVFEKINLN